MSVGVVDLPSCPICIEPDSQENRLIPLNCPHRFHEECIRRWIGQNPTCPSCRGRITHVNGEPIAAPAPAEGEEDFPMEHHMLLGERAIFDRLLPMVRGNQIDSLRGNPTLLHIAPQIRGELLIQACSLGNLEIVQILLESGDVSEDLRDRALYRAASRGHTAVVVELMRAGARSALVRGLALSPAVWNGREGTVISLLVGEERILPNRIEIEIANASRRGNAGIVQALVNYGPISDMYRYIALKQAAIFGSDSVIPILIDGLSLQDRLSLATTAICCGNMTTASLFIRSDIPYIAAAGVALAALFFSV